MKFIALILTILVSSNAFSSCGCSGELTPEEAFDNSDKIYLGRFIAEEPPSDPYKWEEPN